MSDSGSSSGIGFVGLLTILFIGLKLTHYIEWSWWWVLLPVWGPLAVLASFVIGYGVVALWAWFSDKVNKERSVRWPGSKR